jgi:hypothetical protein
MAGQYLTVNPDFECVVVPRTVQYRTVLYCTVLYCTVLQASLYYHLFFSGAILSDIRDLGDIVSWTNMAR